MADYQSLENTPLEMDFVGGRVDLLSLGVAQISLQRITEKVAHEMLSVEGVLAPGWKWSTYPSRWFQPEYPRLTRVEVVGADAGSYQAMLAIAVHAALSDPHVIAILDNLAANVVWAIFTSGLEAVRGNSNRRFDIPERFRRQQRDPYRVEALVRDTVLVAQENPNIKAIRYRANEYEVILDLEFYRDRRG